MGFGFGMNGIPVLMNIFFVVFIIVFIAVIVKNIAQWSKNNHSPRLTIDASIVAKRTNVQHHMHNNDGMPNTTTNTTYYVTFQVESGDRMELRVKSSEYGMLAEGDRGQLTFQGTRYLGFERIY